MSAILDARTQWTNPSNIMDLLLLVGSDIIKSALAQLSGTRAPTPVVFSFGWVAYSFSALVAVVGDQRLLPQPDVQSIVINALTGNVRDNRSWVLGRLLRDFEEEYWMPPEVKQSLVNMMALPVATLSLRRVQKKGLCISIFEADPDPDRKAKCTVTWPLLCLGYLVTIVQLVVAAIPWIIGRDTDAIIFLITVAGTILAYSVASLPQWRRERFDCRENTQNNIILTRGNGAQHALVILGQGRGLNLEDLAASGDGRDRASRATQVLIFISTVLWVALLITVSGVRSNTWFLIAVGGIGSAYTILVAGLPRTPLAFGIPLRWTEKCITNEKVMIALMEAELYMPGLGKSMLATFFPGERTEIESQFWAKAKLVELKQNPPVEKKEVVAMAKTGLGTMDRILSP